MTDPLPTIRRADANDVGRIRDLTRAAYTKWIPVIGREPIPMTADYDLAIREHVIDLLYLDEQFVALVEMKSEADHLLIVNIAVAPEHQGKGHGTRLMAHAERIAKSYGHTEMRLYTNKMFVEDIALYLKLGYGIDSEAVGKHGGIRVNMSKRLG